MFSQRQLQRRCASRSSNCESTESPVHLPQLTVYSFKGPVMTVTISPKADGTGTETWTLPRALLEHNSRYSFKRRVFGK
jgi:hypothetical protein